jgi:predicted CoA-substrate-specific enzyme activase
VITCGCDIGSTYVKVALMDEKGIVATSIVQIDRDPDAAAETALAEALKSAGITKEGVKYIVGTGYRNPEIPFANKTVSEMTCHSKGANWANPKVRTVIDIGGQDCRVMRVNAAGDVDNFVMNDKCAAGTGLFLSDIAGVLELKVEDLGEVSKQSTKEVKVSDQCSVFALSEVISLVALKVAVPDIVAGIHSGVANRIVSMVHRLGLEEEFLLSGGVSKNSGVVRAIEGKLNVKLVFTDINHQLMGAIGAAVLARNEA